jgi:hypothetical protein
VSAAHVAVALTSSGAPMGCDCAYRKNELLVFSLHPQSGKIEALHRNGRYFSLIAQSSAKVALTKNSGVV